MPAHKLLSQSQTDILLSFMDDHRDLASGVLLKNPGPNTKREVNDMWEKLTLLLNAEKGGIKKSSLGWRQYWNEKKYGVRRKAGGIQSRLTSGQKVKYRLSSEELKVLKVMGRLAGKGGMRGAEVEYNMQGLVQDDISTDPLDHSAHEEKFKPDSPEVHKPTTNHKQQTKCRNSTENSTNGNTVPVSDGPPQWAINIEERRTAAAERLATSIETLTSAVVGMHKSLCTLTQEVAAIRAAVSSPP